MPSLSVAMIVKNEGAILASCLETVKDWVDEIIILDSGSTDNTMEIALQMGAKVYQHTDWQGFGKQRQIAQQYITSDYVLWLDADEHVSPALREEILSTISANEGQTVYAINRLSEVFGKKIYHSGWYPDYVVRLYRTNDTHYNDSLVHESVIIPHGFSMKTLKKGQLLHYTYQNLHHYLIKSANYAKAWADQRQAQGKKSNLWQACLHASACFIKMFFLKKGFLDGRHGLLLALLSAHSTFIKYADLWIREKKS